MGWAVGRRARARIQRGSGHCRADRGSIIPLVLGFCLLAMLFIAGAVATSDVFTKQRALQSICDGAAIYAANNVQPSALHGAGTTGSSLPLADATTEVLAYLARNDGAAGGRDAARVRPDVSIAPDGVTVRVACHQHNSVAFGAVILKANGVDQVAYSAARSRIVP